jgi:hypothetical protein
MDSDAIEYSNAKDDIMDMILDLVGSVQYKLMGIMLIMFIIIMSDTFIKRVLSGVSGAVDGFGTPTNSGTIIQGLILVLSCIVVDIAIQAEVV